MITMDRIRHAAARIAREFSPERIILFGSYAYGTPTADSDVDLLVLLSFEGHPTDKAIEIAQRIDPSFAIDLLVRTPEVVQRRVALGDFFLREVLAKGKVLYAAPNGGMGGEGGGRLAVGAARDTRP